MYCTRCGSPNSDAGRFCEKCGMSLAGGGASTGQAAPPPLPPDPPAQPHGYYADPRVRGGAGPMGPTGVATPAAKNPAVAVLLSFFIPGVGQFYNGDNQKGALMLGGFILSAILTMVMIGFIGMLGIWIWSMLDAYQVASSKALVR
jgi:TM2 domain-containing membrane protein YozV